MNDKTTELAFEIADSAARLIRALLNVAPSQHIEGDAP